MRPRKGDARAGPLLSGICIVLFLLLGAASSRAQVVIPIPPPAPAQQPAQIPSLGPAADLSGLEGKPIVRVGIVLEGNVWNDVDIPAVHDVKAGDTLTGDAARKALTEVLGTGRFARARATAMPEGLGVALVLRLSPRKLIGRLELDLHGANVARDELLREAGLAEGGEIVGEEIGEASGRVSRFLELHGYPSANVDIQTRTTDDPARTHVIIDVTPGAPRIIAARYIYIFGSSPDKVAPLSDTYAVGPKDRADATALDAADVSLEQALHSAGWYRADVSHDLVWAGRPENGGRIVLRVRVDTGPLRVVRFEGNEHYDTEALTAALALDTETDRSPLHLADKLRSFYQRRSFLDVEVRPEVRGGDDDPVQLLVFHIDEHPRVSVVERSYPCLKLEAIQRLSSGGPRSVGDIGNEIDSFLEDEFPGADLLVNPDPQEVNRIVGTGTSQVPTGARPRPIDLRPDGTFVGDTYDRAVAHVQELYRNEGFLHAEVGPAQVLRARCDPRSPPKQCIPLPLPPLPPDLCTYGATGLPLATEPLPQSFTCRPDPSRGIECAPEIRVVIPIKLGPRTRLWDIAFTGVRNVSPEDVSDAALVPLGEPASTATLDDARRRIVDWYKELGYYYVDVRYALEPSPDNTRARARFDVTEGERVVVRAIAIRGLGATREGVVRRRIALEVGQPYRTSDVRKTQERIGTLGVFSSVNVSLEEPYLPESSKTVVIELVERTPQYVEVRPGFSTGEGFRGALEYGHRNLLGYAWGLTVHVQASYLPDFLILDRGVEANYKSLPISKRIATRDTVTMAWPEMGLGPTVRSQIDGVYVIDLERDFRLQKASALGTLFWRPVRQLQLTVGPEYENDYIYVFPTVICDPSTNVCVAQTPESISTYLQNPANAGVARLLRVPDGQSNVVGARVVLTWDRRDNAFNPHRGTFFASGVEQVNSYPVAGSTPFYQNQFEAHFLRLTQTIAGYIPITSKITFATEVRLGEIVNVLPCSTLPPPPNAPSFPAPPYCTYPDRLFFLGGFDSMRGWLLDAFIPQEIADLIASGTYVCTSQSNCAIPLRGGNLMVNPRFELRFPVRPPFDAAVFADVGNLWIDPSYLSNHPFTLRADVGAGVRVETFLGPLVFDYGVNVTPRKYEDFGAFHFAIGLF
jgi:outer membrane protein assembly factor BamA